MAAEVARVDEKPMTVEELRARTKVTMTKVELRRILRAVWHAGKDPDERFTFEEFYALFPEHLRTDER